MGRDELHCFSISLRIINQLFLFFLLLYNIFLYLRLCFLPAANCRIWNHLSFTGDWRCGFHILAATGTSREFLAAFCYLVWICTISRFIGICSWSTESRCSFWHTAVFRNLIFSSDFHNRLQFYGELLDFKCKAYVALHDLPTFSLYIYNAAFHVFYSRVTFVLQIIA